MFSVSTSEPDEKSNNNSIPPPTTVSHHQLLSFQKWICESPNNQIMLETITTTNNPFIHEVGLQPPLASRSLCPVQTTKLIRLQWYAPMCQDVLRAHQYRDGKEEKERKTDYGTLQSISGRAKSVVSSGLTLIRMSTFLMLLYSRTL